MKTQIQIENNVPVISKYVHFNNEKYPVSKLGVARRNEDGILIGDSFKIPCSDERELNKIRFEVYFLAKKKGISIVSRKDVNNGIGLRVWRRRAKRQNFSAIMT